MFLNIPEPKRNTVTLLLLALRTHINHFSENKAVCKVKLEGKPSKPVAYSIQENLKILQTIYRTDSPVTVRKQTFDMQ